MDYDLTHIAAHIQDYLQRENLEHFTTSISPVPEGDSNETMLAFEITDGLFLGQSAFFIPFQQHYAYAECAKKRSIAILGTMTYSRFDLKENAADIAFHLTRGALDNLRQNPKITPKTVARSLSL